jgi:hypothetical protein
MDFSFLHRHPHIESNKNIDPEHVVVDLEDWQIARDCYSESSFKVLTIKELKKLSDEDWDKYKSKIKKAMKRIEKVGTDNFHKACSKYGSDY